jgi:hypothetical protein
VNSYAWDTNVSAGTPEMIKATGETVEFTLIPASDWPTKLLTYLAAHCVEFLSAPIRF